MGTLMSSVPLVMLVGVAPVASTVAVAVPVMAVLPRAAAAPTMLAGNVTKVWKFVSWNC